MTDKAVMMGDYVDLKFLPGLKSARVFVDIPIEHSNTFLKMFDAPDRTNPVKVAIARIQLPAEQSSLSRLSGSTQDDSGPHQNDVNSSVGSPTATKGEESADTARSYSRSQIAAIKCQDHAFYMWLTDREEFSAIAVAHPYALRAELADFTLKKILGIASKTELDTPGPKAEAWDKLLCDFDLRAYAR